MSSVARYYKLSPPCNTLSFWLLSNIALRSDCTRQSHNRCQATAYFGMSNAAWRRGLFLHLQLYLAVSSVTFTSIGQLHAVRNMFRITQIRLVFWQHHFCEACDDVTAAQQLESIKTNGVMTFWTIIRPEPLATHNEQFWLCSIFCFSLAVTLASALCCEKMETHTMRRLHQGPLLRSLSAVNNVTYSWFLCFILTMVLQLLMLLMQLYCCYLRFSSKDSRYNLNLYLLI